MRNKRSTKTAIYAGVDLRSSSALARGAIICALARISHHGASKYRMDRDTAYAYADEIWESQSDELLVLDCRMMHFGHSYGLRVSYDWMGDHGVRTLKTIEGVEQFLYGPFHSNNEASPEIESWDADMGL
jgi:hypothetical protein